MASKTQQVALNMAVAGVGAKDEVVAVPAALADQLVEQGLADKVTEPGDDPVATIATAEGGGYERSEPVQPDVVLEQEAPAATDKDGRTGDPVPPADQTPSPVAPLPDGTDGAAKAPAKKAAGKAPAK